VLAVWFAPGANTVRLVGSSAPVVLSIVGLLVLVVLRFRVGTLASGRRQPDQSHTLIGSSADIAELWIARQAPCYHVLWDDRAFGGDVVCMDKIEIRHNQVYRLARRQQRAPNNLARLLRRLLRGRRPTLKFT